MELEGLKQEILRKINLSEMIGREVELTGIHGRMQGLCPFHNENTPSFYVFADHFHCFGCSAHGDVFNYLQKSKGVTFIEALKFLADDLSLPFPSQDSTKGFVKKSTKPLGQLTKEASKFFQEQLTHAPQAQAYLQGRGLDATLWQNFQIGYAPGHLKLHNHMTKCGFNTSSQKEASLVTEYQGKTFDFFHNHLVIPIHNHEGHLIAFGGRALGNQKQKYKNSRYDKRRILYGYHLAKPHIKRKHRAIVVEGYFDTLTMHLHGFEETVACQGTALTSEHLRSLAPLTPLIILLFDGDKAGYTAALKVVSLSLEFTDTEFRVVKLPEGQDPDTFLREAKTSDSLEDHLLKATELLEFAIRGHFQGVSPQGVPKLVETVFLPWLADIQSPLKKSFLLGKIAELSGVDKSLLQRVFQKNTPQAQVAPKTPEPTTSLPPAFFLEFLAHLYFASPDELDLQLAKTLYSELGNHPDWDAPVRTCLQYLSTGRSPCKEPAEEIYGESSNQVGAFIRSLSDKATMYAVKNRTYALKQLQLKKALMEQQQTLRSLRQKMLSTSKNFKDSTAQISDFVGKIRSVRLEEARIREEMGSYIGKI